VRYILSSEKKTFFTTAADIMPHLNLEYTSGMLYRRSKVCVCVCVCMLFC